MKPTDQSNIQSRRPKIGHLWYCGRLIAGPLLFSHLQNIKKEFIASGRYQPQYFKLTY